MTRWQRFLVGYILVAVTAIAVGVAITGAIQHRHTDAVFHASQIDACERGNTLRQVLASGFTTLVEVQIEQIQQQAAQSRTIPPRFFPDIPPKRFAQLQRQATRRAARQLARLHGVEHGVTLILQPVDCQHAFPAP